MVWTKAKLREAWQKLYSRHGLQYGGSGDIKPLEPHLRPQMLVLDAGCGDGKSAEALARKCEVVGCDFSRDALLALRVHRDRDMRVNLVECDLTSMPFESEKFDAIVCIHTLSHLHEADRQSASRELARSLKTQGHLLVENFGREDLRFGEGQEVEECSFMRGNGILTHYFQEGEVPSLFGGMQVISEVKSTRRVSYGPVAGKRSLLRVLMQKA